MATEKEISKLIITLEGQVKNLKKEFGVATEETTKFAKKQKSIVAGLKQNWLLYTAAIYGISRVIKSIAAPFAAFTHKMLEVKTLTNLGTKAFKNLSQTVLDITRRVPQSARELADALYDIVSAGVEVGKSARVLELSAKAAVAGVTNTKTAAKTGLAVINAYGKSIDDLGEVYDILFKTIKEGVLTFDTISGAIGQVLPSAVAAKVAFKDIAASMATMTKVGIGTNRAATALRAGLIALAAPTSIDAMKEMEITWKGWIPTLKQIHEKGLDLKQMRALIPDIRAGQAVIALSQNFDMLVETLDEMDESKGSMEDAFDIMAASPVNKMKMMSNAIDAVKISVMELIAPSVLEGIRLWTIGMNDLAEKWGWTLKGKILKANEAIDESMKEQRNILQSIIEIEQKRADKKITQGIADDTIRMLNIQLTNEYEKQIKAQKEYNNLLGVQEQRTENIIKEITEANKDGDTTIGDTEKIKATAESLKVFNAEVKQSLVMLKNAFDNNRTSVDAYYDSKKLLLDEIYFEEVRVLTDLLNKTKDLKDQEKIRNEITTKGIELETNLMKLQQERTESLEAYAEKQKEVNDILSGIEARTTKKTEYAQELADLQEIQQNDLERIKAKELEKDEYIRQITKARSLWELELKQLQFNQERRIEQKRYEMLASSFNNISGAFGQMYEQSGRQLKAFFLISKAAALAEAIVNYNLAMTKIDAQLGAYSGFAKAAAAVALGANIGAIAASILTMEEGGQVHGKEGRDKVPAHLTNREFVHPVSAVDYYGTGVMEAIRRKSIPKGLLTGYSSLVPRIPSGHFQEGGLALGGEVEREMPLQITNIVDPSLLGQYLGGKQGQGMVVNIISENAYQIKRILRI